MGCGEFNGTWGRIQVMSGMNTQGDSGDFYVGEPADRRHWMAAVLSVLMPGLGHVYAGLPRRGGLVFLLWALCGAIGGSIALLTDILLIRVILGLVVLWTVLQAWSILDLRRPCSGFGKTYILQPYNHVLVYGIAVVLLQLSPLTVLYFQGIQPTFGIVEVDGNENYPFLRAGDRVLFRKQGIQNPPLQRGKLVIAKTQDQSRRILRVIGGPRDRVRVRSNGSVELNKQNVRLEPLGKAQWKDSLPSLEPLNVVGFVETLGTTTYEVFMNLDARIYGESNEELREDQYFLLSDNRTETSVLDSRHLGPFRTEHIEGRAFHVLYSLDPSSGDWRWLRSGIRLN